MFGGMGVWEEQAADSPTFLRPFLADLAVLLTAVLSGQQYTAYQPASAAHAQYQCVIWNTKLKSPCRKQPLPAQNEAYSSRSGKSLEASIPPGVDNGSKVRLRDQADGDDLYLRIKVSPNPRYTRKGSDLTTHIPVDVYTAVLGGEVSVPALDKTVQLTIPAGTDNGKTFRLKGLGMPHLRKPAERGDLYAIVDLHLPLSWPAELENSANSKNAPMALKQAVRSFLSSISAGKPCVRTVAKALCLLAGIIMP